MSEELDEQDPFSPANAPMLNFIMQARIYDVLMGLLTSQNRELAKNLLEIHSTGAIMGPMPSFNGNFVTDEINLASNPESDDSGATNEVNQDEDA